MDVREKLVEQAISYFWYGVSHDIFSEPVTTYAKLAIEALKKENGVTVQEWISVDDRLPEKYAMVLIYDGDSVEPSLFFGDLGFYEADKYEANPFCGVTHWMPLPMPPKGE